MLSGNAGNNILDGGAGADTMNGGAGDDSYNVTEATDVVNEALNAGNDTVTTTLLTYSLGANVENLIYTGAGNFTGRGNADANRITGSTGNDVLIGNAGADTMLGGAGNDAYQVLDTGDVVTENAEVGTDIVFSNLLNYTLTDNVENLALLNAANINGTGNAGNNAIAGNAGNNILSGGVGTDFLTGGLGADTFDFDAAIESLVGLGARDIITDFRTAQGDKIDLSTIDASVSTVNDQAFLSSILSSGAFTAEGQLRLVGNVLSGNTDSDFTTSEFEIQLTGVTTLTGADFIL